MKIRWVFTIIFLVSDLLMIGAMHIIDFPTASNIVTFWNSIHEPIATYAESLFIEYIPSHGGGWKAVTATFLFFIINIFYFIFIGFIFGLLFEKIITFFKKT